MWCVPLDDEFREKYPHLYDEIKLGKTKRTIIKGVRTLAPEDQGKNVPETASAEKDPFRGFMPTVIDFIRRCDTESEALEIIDYMERRGEISSEYAYHLRRQLSEQGLRSFGSKKESGFYFMGAPR